MSTALHAKPWHFVVAIILTLFAPVLLLFAGPALIALNTLKEANIHPGIILLCVIAAIVMTFIVLFFLFALLPQGILLIFGFLLYGLFGHALGSDPTWKITLGILAGLVGSMIMALVGRTAKRFRASDERYLQ